MPKKASIQKAENARNRKATLMRKAYEFGELFGADVALIIKQKRQYSVYTSTDNENWPPPMVHIRLEYPLPKILFPHDVKARIRVQKMTDTMGQDLKLPDVAEKGQ